MSEKQQSTLLVNEIFGPTIQGEGKSITTPVIFIRLSGCNLACKWCDTPYTWNWKESSHIHSEKYDPKKEIHLMSLSDVVKKVVELSSNVNRIVISGGEPLLQEKVLCDLFLMLKELRYTIEVETNGTIQPSALFFELVDQINCSPKLSNSGPDNLESKRIKPKVLNRLVDSPKTNLKFVVANEQDMKEIQDLVKTFKISSDRVYLMPEGRTKEEQFANQKKVYDLCMFYGYNFSPRLHILIHDTKRGV